MSAARPSSRLVFVLFALLGVLTAQNAIARDVDSLGVYGERRRHDDDQWLALELRFGPYTPDVDGEFSGATPYASTFGDDTRFCGQLEVDWQLLRIPSFGSLGPGLGLGYTHSSGKALVTGSTTRSQQSTGLTIWPFYLVGVLRVDVLARDTSIPLVPYAKLGLGYALWSVSDGDDTAKDEEGRVGRGSSYGPQFALGGMFLLDALDRDGAGSLDYSVGVKHSYIFAEWYKSQLDNFGSGDAMQVGTSTFFLGLAIEL
jgi:hypothetical protein